MNEIKFKANLAGKERRVDISEVSGGSSWHLLIDDYYRGRFMIKDGEWIFLPHDPSRFTAETTEMLLRKIREFHGDTHS